MTTPSSKSSSKFEERGVAFQIPRNSLALLMVAQAIVVLPHAWQLPPWIIAAGLFCGFWRSMVYQGRWDYPRQWVKAVLVLTSGAAVAISARYGLSLEAASSLLIIAFALKLIEMKSRRDAYIVIYLCYFTIATEFLFNQSIAIALYGLGAFVVVTAAMIGLNQLHTDVHPLRTLRVSALLVVQALPLMVVLFLFFPRIAPLWSVPLPNQATTGISDVVTPGDIANLVQSDAIVLRAVFDAGQNPSALNIIFMRLILMNR